MSKHVLGQNRIVLNTERPRPALRIEFAAMGIVLLLCLLILETAIAGEPARLQFTRIGPTRIGLFLANANGHNERALLPADGLDYTPSFSADGKWIVFTSERNGSADIFRVHPDGSGLERLTDDPAFDDQGSCHRMDRRSRLFPPGKADLPTFGCKISPVRTAPPGQSQRRTRVAFGRVGPRMGNGSHLLPIATQRARDGTAGGS